MSSDAAATDPHLAEALASAEHRRAMLQELAQIGMHLAQQIDAHAAAAMAAIYEVKAGNPARPFATISRAVRLTLALEARVDAQILAMRNGKLPAGWATGKGMTLQSRRDRAGERPGRPESGDSLRPPRESLVEVEAYDEIDEFDMDADLDALKFDGCDDPVPTIPPDLELEPIVAPVPMKAGVAIMMRPAASALKCGIAPLRGESARGERRLE